jgi:DNA invertase Pin-like site-specific DNA recombinase
MKQVRCAIYTRKSSEDGLEQGFNSLHAQREACAAYVLSQASEGWMLLPEVYDDGGLSGGTLERPALQRLLADVAAGKIDIIVVYKVDRLSRSLLDFAKLVEALDQAGTSFVSITQSFNTTTSMGRLTLNMLLSFAQFEREVTAERIRDKLAASKAKGMWMGGVPPLGYRPNGRTLAVVEEHAAVVRHIYARYLALGTVQLLASDLVADGIAVPLRVTATGRSFGGAPFNPSQLYRILRSPIYVGEIAHRDQTYPGQHRALIERTQWDAVQALLDGHVKGTRRERTSQPALLVRRLFDSAGEPLVATHARKDGKRYRYYVSKGLHLRTSTAGLRLPAGEVEQVVITALAELLGDPLDLATRAQLTIAPDMLAATTATAAAMAAALHAPSARLPGFVERVTVSADGVMLSIGIAALAEALGLPPTAGTPPALVHTCPVRLTRTGRAIRLIHASGAKVPNEPGPDRTLLKLVVKARGWWEELSNGSIDPTSLAAREGITDSYVVRVVRLAFLSPYVVDAMLAGRLKLGVDATSLLKPGAIPLDWGKQEQQFIAAGE